MANPTRVLFLNLTCNPDREQIATTDRVVGEAYFTSLNLQYGGHFIAEGSMKKAASWIVPEDKIAQVMEYLTYKPAPEGYQARMDLRLLGRTTNGTAKYV